MPLYKATAQGYHDDRRREPGDVFESATVYDRKNMPSWLIYATEGEQPVAVDPGKRLDLIRTAMLQLLEADPDKQNPEFWIASGTPSIEALASISGLSDIAAGERDKVWVTIQLPPSGGGDK